MTHLAPSLNPDRTDGLKVAAHSKPFRSENGAVTSVSGIQCAPEATPRPQGVRGPSYTTVEIIKLYLLCAALGFGAMSIAHAKFTHDMAANWEQINEN